LRRRLSRLPRRAATALRLLVATPDWPRRMCGSRGASGRSSCSRTPHKTKTAAVAAAATAIHAAHRTAAGCRCAAWPGDCRLAQRCHLLAASGIPGICGEWPRPWRRILRTAIAPSWSWARWTRGADAVVVIARRTPARAAQRSGPWRGSAASAGATPGMAAPSRGSAEMAVLAQRTTAGYAAGHLMPRLT
jgi:hypothetical protein